MMRHIFLLCWALASCISFNTEAQVLEDYNDRWDISGRETWFDSNDRVSLNLDLNSFPKSYFSFQFPQESVVFIGEKLWFFAKKDTSFTTSLANIKSLAESDSVDLTLFRSGITIEELSARKLIKPENYKAENEGSVSGVLKRDRVSRQEIRDFFVFALLLILVFVTFYKMAYPYIFAMMARPISLLSAEDFSDSGSLQKFFSFDILVFVLIVNLIASLGLILGVVLFKLEWLELRIQISFQNLLLGWLLGSLILLFLTIVKFTGIRIIAYLFQLSKVEFPHFFYLLRLVMIASTGLILISAYFLLNDYYAAKTALGISFSVFFWFYIFGVLLLFFNMMNRLSFKKYHLFTYLCIAELVPFLIISKWVMILGG